MVYKSPKDRVVGPLPNGQSGLQMEVTIYLLIGMILQAPEALVFIVGSHADLVLEHPETEVTRGGNHGGA